MRKITVLFLALFSYACKPTFEEKVTEIINGKSLKVGVAVYDFSTGKFNGINHDELFPLQSVFKFHVAAKVLENVDKGILQLNESIPVSQAEMNKQMYSPMKEELGVKSQSVRLDSLMYYMIAHSDNIACDVLLKKVGGPSEVDSFFKKIKIPNTEIQVSEEEMHQDWETQYKNMASPAAVLKALRRFYLREYLSGDSHNFLYAMMSNTHTGANRIKAGIPKDAVIAHKTGTSGRNVDGKSSATHDAAIVTLKDGKAWGIVIFISESFETNEVNEKVIAEITKAILE